MTKLLPTLFSIFAIAALIEAWVIVKRHGKTYLWRESATSVGIAIGQRIVSTLAAGVVLVVFQWAYSQRLWTVDMGTWWAYPALFFALEFAYYWHHRISHECRWFWATHSVHHSPQQMYLSGAIRLGWTGQISGSVLFFVPLAWLGFPPIAVFGMLLLNLVYQFWLHTELIGQLGWFDKIFNSPSNHRVHHAINPRYLDRNYGGVIMLFDHCFGTYQPEDSKDILHYGLVKQIESRNPLRIAFNEWISIGRDLASVRNPDHAFKYLFARPGWSADGSRQTAKQLRAQWRQAQAQAPSLLVNKSTSGWLMK